MIYATIEMVSLGAKRNVIPAKAGTNQNVQVISCTFLKVGKIVLRNEDFGVTTGQACMSHQTMRHAG